MFVLSNPVPLSLLAAPAAAACCNYWLSLVNAHSICPLFYCPNFPILAYCVWVQIHPHINPNERLCIRFSWALNFVSSLRCPLAVRVSICPSVWPSGCHGFCGHVIVSFSHATTNNCVGFQPRGYGHFPLWITLYPLLPVLHPRPHSAFKPLSAAVKLRQFLCAISVLFVFDCDFINMYFSQCDSTLIEMFRERIIASKSHRMFDSIAQRSS